MDMDFNIEEFLAECENFIEEAEEECWDSLVKTAESALEQSIKEVPKDTESLKNSSFINVNATDKEIIVGYAGPFAGVNPKTGIPVENYALTVHEDLHMPHPRGGKAKFLEDPLVEGFEEFERSVTD